MKRSSKIFLLLTVALVLCAVFAVTAFASDTVGESTVPDGAAIEYTAPNGTVEYYSADEFPTLAAKGGTIKLLDNVEFTSKSIAIKNSLTIDLNGYTLTRAYYYGNHYVATYDEATGTYTETETVYKTATKESSTLFSIQASNIKFTITSTSGGGAVRNVDAKCDTWYNEEGEMVKRTILGFARSRLISMISSNDYSWANAEINLNGGISIYTDALFYQTSKSDIDYTINIDNVYSYTTINSLSLSTGEYYAFTFESSGDVRVNITNSLFYMMNNKGTTFMRLNSDVPTSENKLTIRFTNCDVFKSGTGWNVGFKNDKPLTLDMVFII